MANYIATDTDLEAVADAIRTKGETSADLVFPQGFVDAIDAIETGGGGGASVTALSAVYTQPSTTFQSTDLSELYDGLVVTATINGLMQIEVPPSEYTLSGSIAIGTRTITVSYGGKTTTFSVVVEEAYERKTYIESDGNCYIDLGFTSDQRTVMELDYMSLKNQGDAFQCIMGVTDSTIEGTVNSGNNYFVQLYSANTMNWAACASQGTAANSKTIANFTWDYGERKQVLIYPMNPNIKIMDGDTKEAHDSMGSNYALDKTIGANFTLFARNRLDEEHVAYAVGRIYSFKSKSRLLAIRDCVPVKRLSDNKYGLLDLVFGGFYGATGSGSLTGA